MVVQFWIGHWSVFAQNLWLHAHILHSAIISKCLSLQGFNKTKWWRNGLPTLLKQSINQVSMSKDRIRNCTNPPLRAFEKIVFLSFFGCLGIKDSYMTHQQRFPVELIVKAKSCTNVVYTLASNFVTDYFAYGALVKMFCLSGENKS